MLISQWTATLDKRAAMHCLQQLGVPAGAVLDGRDLLEDPHLAARDFYQTVDHSVAGPQRQRTWPFRLHGTPATIRWPAPRLGEHTRQVLGERLGYTEAESDELERAGVTGDRPRDAPA